MSFDNAGEKRSKKMGTAPRARAPDGAGKTKVVHLYRSARTFFKDGSPGAC
jgi:hypothetical protein